MTGGVIGQLFVLFGVKTHDAQFKAANEAIKRLKAVAAVTGVVELAKGFFHLAEEAAESATHVHSLSQAMGMSIGQAQRWAYVAEQSGSNLKELAVGVSMFQSNLRKLATGDASPKLLKMFREMRLNVNDAKMAMAGPEGLEVVMMKTADRIKEIGVKGQSATLAYRLFGARAGRALLADMIRGSDSIRVMFDNITAKGGIISDKSIIQLQGLFDAINDIKKAWHGVSGELIGTLAPVIIRVLDDTANWFAQNREVIGHVLTAAINIAVAALKAFMAVFSVIANAINAAFNGEKSIIAVLTALVILIAVALIPVLLSAAAAAWAMALPFLIAWGVPLLLLSALVYVILQVADGFAGMAASASEAWDAITSALGAFWDWFKAGISHIGEFFLGFLKGVWDGISFLLNGVKTIAMIVRDAVVWVWDGFWGIVHKAIAFFMDKINWVKRQLAGIWNAVPGHDKVTWGQSEEAPTVPVPTAVAQHLRQPGKTNTTANPPAGSSLAGASAKPSAVASNVSVGPTTVNIYGVKDAAAASNEIADKLDGVHRHAFAGLSGEA